MRYAGNQDAMGNKERAIPLAFCAEQLKTLKATVQLLISNFKFSTYCKWKIGKVNIIISLTFPLTFTSLPISTAPKGLTTTKGFFFFKKNVAFL